MLHLYPTGGKIYKSVRLVERAWKDNIPFVDGKGVKKWRTLIPNGTDVTIHFNRGSSKWAFRKT